MSEFTLTRIDRLRYRPTREAEEFLGDLRSSLIPGDKATVARLAIGRSLAEFETGENIQIPDGTEMGNAIEGIHLFGDDADIWACLIAAAAEISPKEPAAFRSLVEAHWNRGALLLKTDYEDVKKSDMDFVIRLAGMLPAGGTIPGDLKVLKEKEGPVLIKFGSESIDPVSGEAVFFTINAPGISPHVAILGKTRSGKTRTGLEIGRQIVGSADLPVLLLDPKGEFVKNGELVSRTEWGGQTLEAFFPGIRPLDVPRMPVPLDFLWRPPEVNETELAQLAIAFQDSFQKCIRVKGDIKLDLLRQTVLTLLQGQRILDNIESLRRPITLEAILHGFTELSEQNGQSVGSIGAKLGAITSLNMFEPKMSPGEFFSGRWVVGFGAATDEPKRLAIFLILDALNSYFMSLGDSRLDQHGNRTLRHMLIIDEAVEILRYRHGALSSLVRKSASKGGIVMLLSQSADDFDQESDDFLEQMGTVGVFALSSSTVKCLDGAFGRKMRIEDFSDRVLSAGTALVKRPGATAQKILAWK
ncbi:helicase HerA domain-containing protein [Methylocaldum gracile]|jgi:DNA sulfur modification protein DndE